MIPQPPLLTQELVMKTMKTVVNSKLSNLNEWLTLNKLTLNAKKSNYVSFRPHQKRLPHSIIIKSFNNKTNAFVQLE